MRTRSKTIVLFGRVIWKANGVEIGSFTCTSDRNWGTILISQGGARPELIGDSTIRYGIAALPMENAPPRHR